MVDNKEITEGIEDLNEAKTASDETGAEVAATAAMAPVTKAKKARKKKKGKVRLGPPDEELDRVYVQASSLYQDLWHMSRGTKPVSRETAVQGRQMLGDIERLLRNCTDDYALFRKLWKQDTRALSEALRFEKQESVLRNLADVQNDLMRAMSHADKKLGAKLKKTDNVFKLLESLD
jgi:hypothetical protein